MNLKGEKKRFIYNGIILMMLCLTVLVVFKSNVFAADSARTSYVGASGCTLVFQKEWDDGGAVSDRPKSITFLVDLADTNRPGGSSSPPTEKVSITLNAENNWTYTYPKVDYKTYGYIPESVKELAVDGYEYTGETVKWEGKDAGGYGGTVTVTLNNKKKVATGNLTVTKEVAGTHGDKDKEFHFTVTLDDKTISGKFGDMDFTDGVATFTLKHGQSATATGLPAGIGYTVKETEANQNGYVTTSTADKGTVSENGNAEIRFTNTKSITGNLKVTKEVAGTHGDKEKEFHFTVTLDDKTISGKFGDMDFTDGVATFTLKHGQSATATGLPAGIGYTVKETEANQDGYVTTSTADKGTVPENGNVEIKFINHKEVTSEKPSTPDKSDTLDSPKTGDRTNIELYISLYAMSGLLIAILTVLKKKKILKNR